jgi:hypothetical protein
MHWLSVRQTEEGLFVPEQEQLVSIIGLGLFIIIAVLLLARPVFLMFKRADMARSCVLAMLFILACITHASYWWLAVPIIAQIVARWDDYLCEALAHN